MNKHTPGPWVVYTNPVTGSHVIGQTDGPPIVKLKAGQVSNAHLIAAAPAMYVALQKISDLYRKAYESDGEFFLDESEIGSLADAALAQAEGRDK